MAKETKARQKARLTTRSPLDKKYNKELVSKARDIVKAEEGVKRLTTPRQWAAAGEIAKTATREHRKLTLYKVDRVKKRTTKKGVEPGYYARIKPKKK